MATWSNPIYDRTLADVEYAKQQLEKQINNVDYKGCLNGADLTRIDQNTQYLSEELIKLYYFNKIVPTGSWASNNIVTASWLNQIFDNINKLLVAYQKPSNAPAMPTTLLTYEQVNNIEKNLYLIKDMMDKMKASFKECGTFGCGEG